MKRPTVKDFAAAGGTIWPNNGAESCLVEIAEGEAIRTAEDRGHVIGPDGRRIEAVGPDHEWCRRESGPEVLSWTRFLERPYHDLRLAR